MHEELKFFIKCNPPKSTAQASLRIMKKKDGSQFVGKFASSKGQNTQNDLMSMLSAHVPDDPFCGPILLIVEWCYPWRKSEPKKNMVSGSKPCTTRPDIDNLCKLLFDCMTRLRFWNDDSYISTLIFTKSWSDNAGIGITIKDITQ